VSINTVQIDSILERLALQDAYRFNAYQIAALSHEDDIVTVNRYLMSKVQFGVLNAKLEFLCPDNHPDFEIEIGRTFPDNLRECRICDEEYIPDLESSHIVFYFDQRYIADVKKKHQYQSERLAI